jgi:hypothetical protein
VNNPWTTTAYSRNGTSAVSPLVINTRQQKPCPGADDSEVGQYDSLLAILVIGRAEDDVGELDVAVQQPLLVCVVQGAGQRRDDRCYLVVRLAGG